MTYQEWFESNSITQWGARVTPSYVAPLHISWQGHIVPPEVRDAILRAMIDHPMTETEVKTYYGLPLVSPPDDPRRYWQYTDATGTTSGGQMWKNLVEAAREANPDGDPVAAALKGEVLKGGVLKKLRFGPDKPTDDDGSPDVELVAVIVPTPEPPPIPPAVSPNDRIAALEETLRALMAIVMELMNKVGR